MANLNVTITIPEAYIVRANAAFNGLAGKRMLLKNEISYGIHFTITPKQIGETAIQFRRRFIRQSMVQFIRLFELDADTERYNAKMAIVPPAIETVPDDVII